MIEYRFKTNEIKRCKEFGKEISWKHPHFKDRRNKAKRSRKQIEDDVLRGKLAEVAVFNIVSEHFPQQILTPIDFNVYEKDVFDNGDLFIYGKELSVKASKPGSSCLLIEKQRFVLDKNNHPKLLNRQKPPHAFAFVQVDTDSFTAHICGGILFDDFWKKKRLLPIGFIMNKQNAKKYLLDGCRLDELTAGRGVPMLADNYGVHVKQLTPFEEILKRFNR